MNRNIEEILKEALALPAEIRAALADTLLDSLESGVDPGVEEAWRSEIRRRRAELDSNSVAGIPWTEVRSQLISTLRNGE
jgi:putative addiction module component (TIGR02574 family)